MTPEAIRGALFLVAFGLLEASAFHYGGGWAMVGTAGAYIWLSLLRK
jgi:hypothetical protein